MIRRPPRSTQSRSSAASDVYKRQAPAPAPEPGVYKRVFLVLVVTMACNGFVYAGMMYTVPKVFEIGLAEARPDSYTGIGMLTGAVIGLSSVCSYVGGWLAERYSPRWVYLVFWALLIPALVVVTVVSGFSLIFSMLLAMSFLCLLYTSPSPRDS